MVGTTEQPAVARRISYEEQVALGMIRSPTAHNSRFVAPDRQDFIPSRHEIVDPYASSYPPPLHYIVRHEYSPITRSYSMLIKTSAVTLFLSILTGAAMLMLDHWSFLAWLLLASLEWVFCFVLLAMLDWQETPSALAWKMSNDYMILMEREQRARLKRLYGYEEDY
jgi:hypothetical protein